MRPGDKFIKLFNELSEVLQAYTDSSKIISFAQLLKNASESSPTINRSKYFLRRMGDLRNAIVHDPDYPEEIIADPRPEVIQQFEETLKKIKSPKKVFPGFRRKIRIFAAQDALGDVLMYMQENDYSQIIIQIDQEYRILSSEGIVKWLGSARHVGLADLEGACLKDAYKHEDKKAFLHMARYKAVDEAILAFENSIKEGIPRLHAILITNNGKSTEKPIGIITPWDLLGIAS